MTDILNWGIVGTGNIANQFANGITYAQSSRLSAVCSRSLEKASQFAGSYQAERYYDNIQQFLADDVIDIVYIGTPHTDHYETTLNCINAGKAVLCEKPFTINRSQAHQVFTLAKKKNVFVMEAMWTMIFPLMEKVRDVIASGLIGKIQWIQADFGFQHEYISSHRLFNLNTGGGALLDVGIYPIALCLMVAERLPDTITSSSRFCESGTDIQTAMILKYKNQCMASLACAITTQTNQEAYIFGTNGSIHIKSPFWCPERMVIQTPQKKEELIFPISGNGYEYEIDHVHEMLKQQNLESNIVTHQSTLDRLSVMDQVRDQINLKYPIEKV